MEDLQKKLAPAAPRPGKYSSPLLRAAQHVWPCVSSGTVGLFASTRTGRTTVECVTVCGHRSPVGSGRSRMCQWQLKARYDFKARDLQPVVNILFCKVAVIYSSVCESVDPFLPMYLIRVDISDLSVHEAAELIQSSVLVVFYYMTEWFPSRLAFIHYIPQLTFAYFLLNENAFPTLNFDFRITIAAVTGGHLEVIWGRNWSTHTV